MSMVNLNLHTIVLVVLCHLIGDYVLQCDFIAQTKGKNWYHLFVHCALYCVPFLIAFGWTWQLSGQNLSVTGYGRIYDEFTFAGTSAAIHGRLG